MTGTGAAGLGGGSGPAPAVRPASASGGRALVVSVVLVAAGEAELRRGLASLLAQNHGAVQPVVVLTGAAAEAALEAEARAALAGFDDAVVMRADEAGRAVGGASDDGSGVVSGGVFVARAGAASRGAAASLGDALVVLCDGAVLGGAQLAAAAAALSANDVDFVCGGETDEAGVLLRAGGPPGAAAWRGVWTGTPASAVCARREVHLRVGGFDGRHGAAFGDEWLLRAQAAGFRGAGVAAASCVRPSGALCSERRGRAFSRAFKRAARARGLDGFSRVRLAVSFVVGSRRVASADAGLRLAAGAAGDGVRWFVLGLARRAARALRLPRGGLRDALRGVARRLLVRGSAAPAPASIQAASDNGGEGVGACVAAGGVSLSGFIEARQLGGGVSELGLEYLLSRAAWWPRVVVIGEDELTLQAVRALELGGSAVVGRAVDLTGEELGRLAGVGRVDAVIAGGEATRARGEAAVLRAASRLGAGAVIAPASLLRRGARVFGGLAVAHTPRAVSAAKATDAAGGVGP